MSTETAQEFSPTSPSSIYRQLEFYPFTTDPEFQSGLSTIISSTPAQDPELLSLRARCFYFSRKHNVSIDFNSYISWRSTQNLPLVTASATPMTEEPVTSKGSVNGITTENSSDAGPAQQLDQPSAPYPPSFSQIVELITKGEPVPGIKEVPSTVLSGQASAATITKRKKPWEKDESVPKSQEAV
ncbi:MAG: hypothetical protein L6R41_004121 [Letrouitia leprolyta]|nr:MAG: hypothetical protein L6R41_004121 [Letrouitia leprolyta]